MLRSNEKQSTSKSSELDPIAAQDREAMINSAKGVLLPFYKEVEMVTTVETEVVVQSSELSPSIQSAKQSVDDAYLSIAA